MNTLTLEQALELVHPWLGTWRPGARCLQNTYDGVYAKPQAYCSTHDSFGAHDVPMPSATDALMGRTLRKLKMADVQFTLRTKSCYVELPSNYSNDDDPCHAVIIATGMWLQAQR